MERFRILSRVSSSVLGENFTAEDTSSGGTVFIRRLRDAKAAREEGILICCLTHQCLPCPVAFWAEEGHSNCVYEFKRGRTLRDLHKLKDVTEFDAVVAGLTAALSTLHAYGVVHYDVSPGNVLFESSKGWKGVCLLDMGHAARPGCSLRGTPGYIAPEIAANGEGCEQSDVYSAGLVIAEAASAKKLTAGSTIREMIGAADRLPSAVRQEVQSRMGRERAEIITAMVEPIAANRPSAMEVLQATTKLGTESTDGVEAETVIAHLMTSFMRLSAQSIVDAHILSTADDGNHPSCDKLCALHGLFSKEEQEVLRHRQCLLSKLSSDEDRSSEHLPGLEVCNQLEVRSFLGQLLKGCRIDDSSSEYLASVTSGELGSPLFSLSRFIFRIVDSGALRWNNVNWTLVGLSDDGIAMGVDQIALERILLALPAGALQELVLHATAASSPFPVVRSTIASSSSGGLAAFTASVNEEVGAIVEQGQCFSRGTQKAILSAVNWNMKCLAHQQVFEKLDVCDDVTASAVLFHRLHSKAGTHAETTSTVRSLMAMGMLDVTLKAVETARVLSQQNVAGAPYGNLELAYVYAQLALWAKVLDCLAEPAAEDSDRAEACRLSKVARLLSGNANGEEQRDDDPFVVVARAVANESEQSGKALWTLMLRMRPQPSQAEAYSGIGSLLVLLRSLGRVDGCPRYGESILVANLVGGFARQLWRVGQKREASLVYLLGSRLSRRWRLPIVGLRLRSNYGAALVGLGRLSRASALLEDVARSRENAGDFLGAATSWANAGIAYQKNRMEYRALAAWYRQLALLVHDGQEAAIGRVRNRIGSALYGLGKLDEAVQQFKQARWIATSNLQERDAALAVLNQARVSLARGRMHDCQVLLAKLSSFKSDGVYDDEFALSLRGTRARLDAQVGLRLLSGVATKQALSSKAVAAEVAGGQMTENDLAHVVLYSAIQQRAYFSRDASDLWFFHLAEESIELRALMRAAGLLESSPSAVSRDIGALRKITGEEQLLGLCALSIELIVREVAGRPFSGRQCEDLHSCAESLQEPGLLWRSALACSLKCRRLGHWGECLGLAGDALRNFLLVVSQGHLDHGLGFQLSLEVDALMKVLGAPGGPEADAGAASMFRLGGNSLGSRISEALVHLTSNLRNWQWGANGSGHGIEQILRVAQMLNESRNVDTLLARVAESLMDLCDAEGAYVVLLDDAGIPSIRVSQGVRTDETGDLGGKVSKTIVDEVIHVGRAQIIRNALDDERFANTPSILGMSLKSAMCAPLKSRGEVFGAIYVENRSVEGCFTRDDLKLLDVFSNNVASAIVSARLFTDLERSYEALESATDRIVRAEKMKVLGELASGVAHDFNNLLTSILIRAQSLGLEEVGDHVRGELLLIEKAALDGASVIRRIQDYTRVRQHSSFERVDLRDAVLDAIEFTRGRWGGSANGGDDSACDVVILGFPRVSVSGNASELREVFTNLILNAIDSMPSGGRVSIGATLVGSVVRVECADTGHGVPPELAETIFDPFFSTRGESGNGLGLSVAYGIVSRHSGRVWVESDGANGSRFFVELPLLREQEERVDQQNELAPGRGIRALVVDDDVLVREGVAQYLKSIGCEVLGASSGEEALSMDLSQGVDLVISDFRMTGMSGTQLLQEFSQRVCGATLVLMTGLPPASGRTQPTPPGVDVVIRKPFDVAELRALVIGCQRHR